MNKRQKKKFDKKLGCKSYDSYRSAYYTKLVQSMAGIGPNDIPYFILSKNKKHIVHFYVLKDCYPISVGDGSNTNDNKELNISFRSNISDEMTIRDVYGRVYQMYRMWLDGIREEIRQEGGINNEINENKE